MIIENLSGPLTRALAVNSEKVQFEDWLNFDVLGEEPTGDGTHDVGQTTTPPSVIIYPFAAGDVGTEFWMRVWGWRGFGNVAAQGVWVPLLLAEMMCVVCDRPGKGGRLIAETERLCDQAVRTAGIGSVYSPGSNHIAFAAVPLMGCHKIKFDIASGNAGPCFGNALWARF